MAQPFLFLLFLLTYFTGALAQFTMTQPPSLSVPPQETVSITCTREGGSISAYYVSWYQQKSGTKPLPLIYQHTNRPSGIPERFSGSIDSSSNLATLSISHVRPEDEADYYCASYDSNYQCTRTIRGERVGPSTSPTMSRAFLLSMVLISVDPSLQQLQNLKDPEFVALGGTVTISCRYDSGSLGDGNYPWWSQQIPGNKPRALIYTTSNRPSGVPERFSGSRSGNVMSLTITGAQLEDEAFYYCCVWTGSQFHSG
ncbi:immunoglobulin lambda-1 light chain-like [Ahaetulla prasina]|uniref:immunoglobulin lambda-1 light chain-like n=1 Tax=Ahaetulla prasina TaxID=499056 RepID=UPI0026497462|nr:immunoglobulin lambda-1 light chain-like [Ahaetulla prasina]